VSHNYYEFSAKNIPTNLVRIHLLHYISILIGVRLVGQRLDTVT